MHATFKQYDIIIGHMDQRKNNQYVLRPFIS